YKNSVLTSKRKRILYINNSFFFSSRRRHTRFSRDWSSDVCSSDLPTNVSGLPKMPRGGHNAIPDNVLKLHGTFRKHRHADRGVRSEERRVGKGCGTQRTKHGHTLKNQNTHDDKRAKLQQVRRHTCV